MRKSSFFLGLIFALAVAVPAYAAVENIKLSAIDERFHDAVAGTKRGELSAIVEADEAMHVVYVCEKDEGLGLPSRETLEDRAYARELGRIATQYLRDLERNAMVDIRLKAEAPPNG